MLPFEKFIGLFSVVRGYNIMMICIAQYLTAIFILSRQPLRQVLLDPRLFAIVLAGALAVAGGYIINAFYDQEKDLINKPTRTLMERMVGQHTKLSLYFILNFLSVIVASYVSFRAVLFFSIYIFMMWFYSQNQEDSIGRKYRIRDTLYYSFLCYFCILSQFPKDYLCPCRFSLLPTLGEGFCEGLAEYQRGFCFRLPYHRHRLWGA